MRQVKTNKLAHLGAGCIMSAECYTLRENGGAAHVSAAWHMVRADAGRQWGTRNAYRPTGLSWGWSEEL
jgi:hypothetical protein